MKIAVAFELGVASLFLASSARAGVISVDAAGSAPFTNLQAAVNAAQPGDTLLVRQGAYGGFTVHQKSLSIVADQGATVTVSGTATVESLLPSQTVLLAGLLVTGTTSSSMAEAPGTGLIASGNAGSLRLEECRFEGAHGYGDGFGGNGTDCCDFPDHAWGWHGALVAGNPAGVAFVRCTLVGGRGANGYFNCYCGDGKTGGDGLHLSDGRVAVYDCALTGGRGGNNGYAGGPGGAGARLVDSSVAALSASNTAFQGGGGGDGYDYVASVGGSGGDGAVLDRGVLAWFVECTETGGVGGQACNGLFPPGPDGVGGSGKGSSFIFATHKVVLSAPRIGREQAVLPLTIEGRPGDAVYLVVGSSTPFRALTSMKGVLLARSPAPQFIAVLDPIPPSGVLHVGLTIPELGAGVACKTLFLQAWCSNPVDGPTLGSFVPLTLLDSSY